MALLRRHTRTGVCGDCNEYRLLNEVEVFEDVHNGDHPFQRDRVVEICDECLYSRRREYDSMLRRFGVG